MQCPKCNETLERLVFGADLSLYRCAGCHGLFCDRTTLAQLRDEWLADTVLDTGDVAVGSANNNLQDIRCPACAAVMQQVSDPQQTHINLDACTACDGIFLDAGELTDMKSVTLMDHVRRLLTMLGK